MTMKNLLSNLSTQKFYVAEIVKGNAIRVTADYDFKADAETAMKRMHKGNYVVKTA